MTMTTTMTINRHRRFSFTFVGRAGRRLMLPGSSSLPDGHRITFYDPVRDRHRVESLHLVSLPLAYREDFYEELAGGGSILCVCARAQRGDVDEARPVSEYGHDEVGNRGARAAARVRGDEHNELTPFDDDDDDNTNGPSVSRTSGSGGGSVVVEEVSVLDDGNVVVQRVPSSTTLDDAIVGVASARFEPSSGWFGLGPSSAYLMTLVVAPSHRRCGVASALVDTVAALMRVHFGARRLYLHALTTNVPALRFYERLGFRNSGVLRNHYLIDGEEEDAYLLERREDDDGVVVGGDSDSILRFLCM